MVIVVDGLLKGGDGGGSAWVKGGTFFEESRLNSGAIWGRDRVAWCPRFWGEKMGIEKSW